MKYNATISKPYVKHFRNFYCDTATQAFAPGQLKLACDFFGAEHVLFGTDVPYDAEDGRIFYRDTIKSVEALSISDEDRRARKRTCTN